jgi:hypothetical protein
VRRLLYIGACTLALAAGCKPKADPSATAAAAADSIVRTSESGPVKATVTLAPAKPTLGDTLRLTLEVTAAKGVDVEMPAFGEALGRFAITAFTPRRTTLPDGTTRASQEYQLEAPMSGKQKVPSLLVEFTDRRAGAPLAAVDGGAGRAEPSELLTDEITLDVASVVDGEETAGRLRGPLGPLDERVPSGRRLAALVAAGAAAAIGLAAAAIALARRRRRRAAVRDPFGEALARLDALERAGLPAPEAADAWYVEVSGIVRRYLEDRFALRAPELTTEEFLSRAGEEITGDKPPLASGQGPSRFAPAHRAVLRGFLEKCDRVKFAAYRPPESESREVIAAARRFLDETRSAVASPATEASHAA